MPLVRMHPQTGLPMLVQDDGEIRMLGRIPDERPLRDSRPSFSSYLASVGKSLIPRSQWRTVNRRKTMGAKFITNQRNSSACVGYSDAQATSRLYYLKGYGFVRFSGMFIYAHINGNRDAGAMIGDSMIANERYGVCLESEFDYPNRYLRQIPESAKITAKRFKCRLSYTVDTFDEIGTAIQMGFVPQFPVQVGGNFGSLDSEGVCGVSNGYGNHSVHGDGTKFSSRWGWLIDQPNSWGTSWGQEGRGYLAEKHFNALRGGIDGWVHVDFIVDPQDPNPPPRPI